MKETISELRELIAKRKATIRHSAEYECISRKSYVIAVVYDDDVDNIGYEVCHNCNTRQVEHADNKCLYDTTFYLGERWVTYQRHYPDGTTRYDVMFESQLEELLILQKEIR